MNNYIFTLGFESHWAGPEYLVDYVFPNSNVNELEIKEGDTLIYFGNVYDYPFKGQLGTEAEFYLSRGTAREVVKIKYDQFRWLSKVDFSYEFMDGDYIRVIPKDKLVPGLYCLRDTNPETNELNLFTCFLIEE